MNKFDYMQIALEEAKIAFKEDEVPIGCVIVKDDEILACTHNTKEKDQKATSHAEILAIDIASKKLNSWYLDKCDIYITLEPCIMCAGAIINARIKNVYIGARDYKGGAFGSSIDVLKAKNINHHPNLEFGICQDESSLLLKDFFKIKRSKVKKTKY